jgi:hypothetical protein
MRPVDGDERHVVPGQKAQQVASVVRGTVDTPVSFMVPSDMTRPSQAGKNARVGPRGTGAIDLNEG